ncbi:MAG: TlpA disulfide reductase family protein [Candidatus Korobacteraceae bacterium]
MGQWGIRLISLTFLLLCTAADIAAQGHAPQFSVQALDGGSITNSSLSGNVVLVQFWATWCGYCRRDQPAVEQLQRDFADNGLTVLAVDVGESPQAVRTYLQKNPRSCQIALDPDRAMAAQFGANAFPHYALLDRNGRIAGTLNGAGGEDGLRNLITRSKVFANADRLSASYKADAAPVGRSTVINVPLTPSAIPSKPLPKTVFIFLNGEQLEADRYLLRAGIVELTVAGEQRQVPLSELDIKKTNAANHERGVEFKVPTTSNGVFLSF